MVLNENVEILPELSKENIPWRLGFEPDAQRELQRVNDLWEDVRKRLIENGTYCRLRPYVAWSET
ncbi:MAG: hypothetical protein PHY47_20090 [Lachnospiraceae bacterium]|nr:hypothetical protein [Lachnospiraceae bacterium]